MTEPMSGWSLWSMFNRELLYLCSATFKPSVDTAEGWCMGGRARPMSCLPPCQMRALFAGWFNDPWGLDWGLLLVPRWSRSGEYMDWNVVCECDSHWSESSKKIKKSFVACILTGGYVWNVIKEDELLVWADFRFRLFLEGSPFGLVALLSARVKCSSTMLLMSPWK